MNIQDVDLSLKNSSYTLTCPNCSNQFEKKITEIKSALSHKQKFIFCSKDCAFNGKRVTKEELVSRIQNYYKEHNKFLHLKILNVQLFIEDILVVGLML